MIGLRSLVLNANYMPISIFPLHTIPVEDAVTRVFNDTCRVVCEYDRVILTQNPAFVFNWPSVIARTDGLRIEEGVKLRRESLYYRDHGLCVYCEQPVILGHVHDHSKANRNNVMTLDHVIPKSMGGTISWENAVTSCAACNLAKGAKPAIGEWAPKRKPYKPSYWQLLNIRRKFPITIDSWTWMDFLGDWEGPVNVRTEF